MDSVSYLLFALLPTGLEDVKVVGVRVKVVHGIQLLEALGEDVHLDWIGFGNNHQQCSTWVNAMMSGRYSWRALSKASLASSASFWAFVAATTDAFASVMFPWESKCLQGECLSNSTYQILVVKQGSLCFEQERKDFIFFLLQLVFSLQRLASTTMGSYRYLSPYPATGCASPPAPPCRC